MESFEEGKLFGATLLRSLRAIPNEYLYFYYNCAEVVAALRDAETRGEYLAGSQAAFYAAVAADPTQAPALWEAVRRGREESYLAEARDEWDRDEQDLAGGGYEEVALDLMRALSGGGASQLIVNVVNGNTVPQLPSDLVLEVACEVDATGARPLPVAPFDLHQLGLIAAVRASERAAIDAVRLGSRAEALRAFAIHPLVGSGRIASELLADLLGADDRLADLLN